jgi:hypothetical protein
MKTVFIWDEMVGEIKFFVVDGDYRHLNNIYINGSDDDEKLDQLNEILAYDDAGKPKVTMLTEFPAQDVKDGAFVIVAGFLP